MKMGGDSFVVGCVYMCVSEYIWKQASVCMYMRWAVAGPGESKHAARADCGERWYQNMNN